MIRRRVRVSGRVQGVSYRYACRREALTCGVAGWVTNRDDGSVEAVFEGPQDAVDAMIAWCRRGPAFASVVQLEANEEEPRGERGFRVI